MAKMGDILGKARSLSAGAPSAKPPRDPKEEFALKVREKFEKYVKGHYDEIPNGLVMPSAIPGIKTINIFNLELKDGSHQVNVTLVHDYDAIDKKTGAHVKKTAHQSGTLLKDGALSLPLPKALQHVDRMQLLNEVYDDIYKVRPEFWVASDVGAVPPEPRQDDIIPGLAEAGPKVSAEMMVVEDPKRLAFLMNQPDVIFGAYYKDVGITKYKIWIFETFVILENKMKGNAAYIVDFDTPITTKKLGELTREEQEGIVNSSEFRERIGKKSKSQLYSEGATKLVHKGEWEKRMQEEIDKRTKK